ERLQGRLAAPVAYQTTRGERRASMGRHHGGRNPPQGNRRRRRSGAVDAGPREDLPRPRGSHGRGRPEEAPRDRALDPREARAEASPARVPRRGVSDLGWPRGRADSAWVAAHLAQRKPSRDGRHGPSVPPHIPHARLRNRRDQASSLDSVRAPSGNSISRRAGGTKIPRIEHRDALAFGSNRSTASVRRRSRSAMTARSRSWDPPGSDSRSPSIVRSKYPKIRRTSSSNKPRLRVRNRSTSTPVVVRRDSVARRYAASTSGRISREGCGTRPRSARSGSTGHADPSAGETATR